MNTGTRNTMSAIDRENHVRIKLWRSSVQSFLHGSKAILKRHGVSTRGYHSMLEIWAAPNDLGLAVGDLAKLIHVRHNTAVGVIDELCRLDLTVRKRLADDRRVVLVQLTSTGREVLAQLVREHLQELNKISVNLRKVLG